MSNTIQGLNRNFAAIIGTAVAFTAAAVVTTACRVISKIITRAPFAFEDYTVFLALSMYIVVEGLMIRAVAVGRHSQSTNDPADTEHTQLVFIYSILYFATIGLCVASILFLYRRIFIKPYIRHATTILLLVTLSWWIACTVVEIGFPNNLPATFPGNPQETSGFRVNYMAWWLSVGIIEQVIIIVAIFMPMREIYHLHLDMQRKAFLMIAFAISYLCVGTGIARLAMLFRPNDPLLDISIGDVWVSCHLGTGIMSANLPICWPIVSQRKRILASVFRMGSGNRPGSDSRLVSSEKTGSQRFGRRVPEYEARTEMDRVVESALLGSMTKDNEVRHPSMAKDMGATSQRGSNSESDGTARTLSTSQASTEGRNNMTPQGSRDAILPNPLELRSVNWRFSGIDV